jgi:shikimate kinase
MNLILIGFKSCGKSSVGKLLAQKLNVLFTDTDQLIEQTYFQNTNEPLNASEIYQQEGKAYFRDLEQNIISDLTHYLLPLPPPPTKKVGGGGNNFSKPPLSSMLLMEERAVEKRQSSPIENIIATGGGTILDEKNAPYLKTLGKLIYLNTSLDNIQTRLNKLPTFAKTSKELALIYEQRKHLYTQHTDYEITTNNKSITEITHEIISLMEKVNG